MKKIKSWIIIQKDLGDSWDGVLYGRRSQAVASMRKMQSAARSGFNFLKVVPCTITY